MSDTQMNPLTESVIDEAPLSRQQLRARVKRKKKRGSRKNVKVIDGKVVPLTPAERKARRKSGKILARSNKKPGTRRKAAKTRRKHQRIMGESAPFAHSQEWVNFITEFVAATGDVRLGAYLVENMDPALTSTKLGVFAMEASDKISETSALGRAFIDATILDEAANQIAFYFEKGDNLTEGTITRELGVFGEAEVLVKPGDTIDEDTESDLYMAVVTVGDNRLNDVVVESEYQYDEDGEPIIESDEDADDIFESLYRDPAIVELKRLISA
jgi:hypothetical protein